MAHERRLCVSIRICVNTAFVLTALHSIARHVSRYHPCLTQYDTPDLVFPRL